MIGLLQRVTSARVEVDGTTVGKIDHGLLVFVCAEPLDTEQEAARLVERIRVLRVFADDAGKMNRSVVDVAGGLLLVPQFTLAADLRRGTRPGFSGAAAPELGRTLFEQVVQLARACHDPVATGQFGAHMQVNLVNDGPVTLWLRIEPPTAER